MTIELAPHNKQGLNLASPLIAGSGAAGFADAWPPGLAPALFGAVITAPLSLRRRLGTPQPRLVEVPGGFLLATGEQNPGFRRIVKEHTPAWRRLGVPLLVSLAMSAVEDWPELAARFEAEGSVAGFELALPEDVEPRRAGAAVAAARRATMLPLLLRLPTVRAAELAVPVVSAGADALTVGTPPLAAAYADDGGWVEAPLGGPAAFPFTLSALHAVAALGLDVPLLAAGGVYSLEDVKRCLDLGARAVQVRSLIWTDPSAARRLADAARSLVAGRGEDAATRE